MNSYGENIKSYRAENKLKQEELAKQLGISSNMLGKIERGERKPNKEVQEKFFYISGIRYEEEIISELLNKLEICLIDYFIKQDISKKEITNLQSYFISFNCKEEVKDKLEFLKTAIIVKETTEYYAKNIFFILEDFYNSISKQYISSIYSNVETFIFNSKEYLIDLLGRINASKYINSKIPLYINTIPLDTHSKTDEYLSNIQINKYKFACIVQDNIMYPKFEKGNIIIVLEDDKYSNGDDVLVSINNETPIIRKILYKENLIVLQTYNDINKTEIYPKEEVKILGKIIEVRYNNS